MSGKEPYKQLKRNTLIIAIGNIGSKAIAFILAPLYSYYLSTSQFGTMDLITTTVSLIMPFFCLDIFEATFRYSNDNEYDERKILSSSLFVCLPGLVVAIIMLIGALVFNKQPTLVAYTIAFIILSTLVSIISQFARGRNEMRVFAATGVINSLSLLVLNIIFLVLIKLELQGWLISFLISQVVTVVYLIFRCGVIRKVRIRYIDKVYIKTFLHFCAPLIPTAAMWWVMNASDRYMIAFFMNASANGIYAVANKLPSILSIFENVFYQAWQTTAISTMDDDNRDKIYSNVFNQYVSFLTVGVIGLLFIGKPLIFGLFASDYSDAWKCLAPLILGVLFHALASNLGSLYSVFKDTNGALYSSAIGAGTNIVLNLIFIPILGIVGAAVTTLIGYIATLIFRWFNVKRFVNLKLNGYEALVYLFLISLQSALYYINNPVSYFIRGGICFFVVVRNRNLILKLIKR